MCLYKVLAIFCFLHLVFGVEFSQARPLYTHLEAKAGSELVIPCVITTDHFSGTSSVKIEWGMIPEGGGPYTPILYRDVTKLQKTQDEDCSLVISPVLQSDSGTYEVSRTVDNVQYLFKKVIVHVTDPTSTETNTVLKHQRNLEIHSETPPVTVTEEVPTMSPTTTTMTTTTDVKFIAKNIYQINKKVLILLVGILAGVGLLIPIIIAALACYYGIHCCKYRPIVTDKLKRMEEGLPAMDEEGIMIDQGSAEMDERSPATEEVLVMRVGDAEGKDVLAVTKERCRAKDEVCIMMDKRSSDIEGEIAAREEMRTLLAEVYILNEKRYTATEKEVAAIKVKFAAMEEELALTKKELAEMQERLPKTEEV